jgi:hypothetical protein
MGGLIVGSDPNLLFDPNCPYTGCRICGKVYQSEFDRTVGDFRHNMTALNLRKVWSVSHAKEHSSKEHLSLAYSGRWCTPEAAQKFAEYGIIAISDMVLSMEHEQALMESTSMPRVDAEGS